MKQFSSIAKFLHWSVAGLIVGQYVLAELAETAKHNDQILDQLALLANHKSVGITILMLALIRLIYRLKSPPPSLPSTMTAWQINASKASHVLLYGLLFSMPISGWLMSSAKAYSVSWFNLVALPDFVAPNESLAELLHTVHHYLSEALFVIALIHIVAALKHHFIDKDEVLARMSSKVSWVLFVLVVVLVVGLFGRLFDSRPVIKQAPVATVISDNAEVTPPGTADEVPSDLPLWNIDYEQSSIKFIGDQAGASFEGEWKKWSAKIQFDSADLNKARFDVSIDLSSGFSNDQERDDTIRSADFFNVASFPKAHYRASTFSKNDSAYQSLGQLSMKNVSADTTLNFNVAVSDGVKTLTGTALLDRFDWNIGTGDWVDTAWVGQKVMVEVSVVTKP